MHEELRSGDVIVVSSAVDSYGETLRIFKRRVSRLDISSGMFSRRVLLDGEIMTRESKSLDVIRDVADEAHEFLQWYVPAVCDDRDLWQMFC